jgi:hydroxypyruvate isomerase
MDYSICIDSVFRNSGSFLEAMKTVKECDFHAIEFWSWWDKDINQIAQAKQELKLDITAFCTKFINPGDISRQEEYLQGLRETVEVAKKLECKFIIIQAGNQTEGISYENHRKNLVEVMRKAVIIAEREKIILLIEPLNILVDHAGYHMWNSKDAFEFCDQIGSPNLKVLYDIYHQQITEGNLISNITANLEKIGHFHSAGVPGRGELMAGEINYQEILKTIKKTGYHGYFGLEYMIKGDPAQSLRNTRTFLNSLGD